GRARASRDGFTASPGSPVLRRRADPTIGLFRLKRERDAKPRHRMSRMSESPSAALAANAPDAELARRVALRDAAAFEALMRRHNAMLFRTARAILRDDAEAEDALQEAYLQAYRSMGTYRGEAKLS